MAMKIKSRFLRKDQYGIMRGTAILSLLLVFAMGLNMHLHGNRDTLAAEERASDAARQIAAQFQQLIEDSISQMEVTAEYLRLGMDDALALNALSKNTVFSASAIIENGNPVCASGVINLHDDQLKTAEHLYDGVQAKIIAQEDNAIHLHIPVSAERELAAWISPERVQEVLGRAYSDDYGYAVYNGDTGVYLINHTHFAEHGYYDALLARNTSNQTEPLLNLPLAQAYISADETAAEPYYIAQMPTKIESWHIALLIPQTLIDFEEGLPTGLYFIGLVTIAVCVAAVVLMSIYVRRGIRRADKAAKSEWKLLKQLAEMAAMQGQVAVFQYNRGENRFVHYFDGINRKKIDACDYGMEQLTQICGFESGELERIQQRCLEMKAGAEAQLNILTHRNGSERFLRIYLNCCENDGNNILGYVLDCTQGMLSQHRIEDERNFYSMMKCKSSSVWQVNASQNCWRISHCADSDIMDRLDIHDRNFRDYENDLNNAIRRYLHPEDYPSYAEEMSVNRLIKMFRSGKTETVHEYRTQKQKNKGYEWHRQVVRVFRDPETQEIMANIFVINVDAEKNAEMERRERARMLQRSLTALGGMYHALFYVDLDNDICYTTKAPGGELISKHQAPFRETFDAYIDRSSTKEDRQKLKDLTGAYMLRKNLSETEHTRSCEYMRISGDNLKKTKMIVQAARFENGTVRDVVIAIRNLE